MKHFKEDEFECICGCSTGFNEMDGELLKKLDHAREKAGVPFRLNSAFRCEDHNDFIGGSPTSRHMKGQAVDIRAETSGERYKILTALISAGFTSIGIYKTFIHADVSNRKLIWRG